MANKTQFHKLNVKLNNIALAIIYSNIIYMVVQQHATTWKVRQCLFPLYT